jgi:hypothetical protein
VRITRAEPAREREQLRIGRLDRRADDRPVGLQQLDEAPVGQRGHDEARDHLQRLVVVERPRQQGARVGQRGGAPVRVVGRRGRGAVGRRVVPGRRCARLAVRHVAVL